MFNPISTPLSLLTRRLRQCGAGALLAGLVVGCVPRGSGEKQLDTPTTGTIVIAADESLAPMVDAQVAAFEAIYAGSHIRVRYLPENEAFAQLLTDSVRLVIGTRQLTTKETDYFKSGGFPVVTTPLAIDAVALLVNNQNPDTLLTQAQLAGVLRGDISDWKQVSASNILGGIKVVFDNSNSGTVRMMKDSLAKVANLPSNCFAVTSNPKVIAYVSQNPAALGLIGVNWISDAADSLALSFLRQAKVMSVAGTTPRGRDTVSYYQPYQSEMALKQYPLTREVYVISRESRAGLGTGFASFVASDRGQRIVQRAGLLPIKLPIRIMQFGDADRIKQELAKP